ncbi:hypothetical protein TSOC_007520 [Tetrabaena socialis]|uniref:Uncharacterized protein n=1 Tax=Tetrabaena socialis TaxID=47790 RepID=A0A2J8A0X7_9CHLO|nr:hypothetical protein TSOC_007520 [Tetrabaena socialis]|eukprot:PNH06138.1 hypothetical protein TSOC_007520 [Tetrabaena socialis]
MSYTASAQPPISSSIRRPVAGWRKRRPTAHRHSDTAEPSLSSSPAYCLLPAAATAAATAAASAQPWSTGEAEAGGAPAAAAAETARAAALAVHPQRKQEAVAAAVEMQQLLQLLTRSMPQRAAREGGWRCGAAGWSGGKRAGHGTGTQRSEGLWEIVCEEVPEVPYGPKCMRLLGTVTAPGVGAPGAGAGAAVGRDNDTDQELEGPAEPGEDPNASDEDSDGSVEGAGQMKL